MKLWLLSIAGALSLFAAGAAFAQVCETYCWRYDQGECAEYAQRCTSPSGPSGPSSRRSYGAIAYDRAHGASGYSDSYGSRSKAESAAMSECAKYAKDCDVAVWFENKCGAVAADSNPTEYWGLGDTDRAARAAALNECVKDGRKGCKIFQSHCSKR
jgi:hypothetical protein